MIMIPCNLCLVLSACKNKEIIVCEILYGYMEKNIEYDDEPDGKLIHGRDIWDEIDDMFQKEDERIMIRRGHGHNFSYIIESKLFDIFKRSTA